MLASQPLSSRMHAGGGISVRVSGATATTVELKDITTTGEGIPNSVEFTPEWAKGTIAWRSDGQHFPVTARSEDTAVTESFNVSPSVPTSNLTPKLVQVIRVNPTDVANFVGESYAMENQRNVQQNSAKIDILSQEDLSYGKQSIDFSCNKKISVMVGSTMKHLIKGEDERSSSGASSAPGSDCERSDSDREADDGTDSGFSPSRGHCARVSVNTNNYSSLTFDSSNSDFNDGLMKTTIEVEKSLNGSKSNNVRLTISSYSDKDTDHKNRVSSNDDSWEMHFHLKELDSILTDKKQDTGDVQTKIATAHALLSGNGSGTYSFKNKVRSSIVSLLVQSASNRNYDHEEMGRIVFYTTSMGIVRNTFESCRKVRKILETLMVKFEERDVFMNRGFQQEVRSRLGTTKVIVPQLFMEGRHLGNAEIVEQLNEIGHLRELLRPYKKQSVGGTCQQCGGYRYLLCPICGGSKKSVTHRHHFNEDLVALRCVTCDESGLIRCSQCLNGG